METINGTIRIFFLHYYRAVTPLVYVFAYALHHPRLSVTVDEQRLPSNPSKTPFVPEIDSVRREGQ